MPYSSPQFRRRIARALCGFLLALIPAGAQPIINANAIVNSASYLAPGLPGSGIAQGSIFTISGTGLGPDTGTAAPGVFPLPTTLAGTSVNITANGAKSNAVILYTSSLQISAILPSTTPVGAAEVTVTFNDQTSNDQTSAPITIQVVAGAFGIFTFNSVDSGRQ
jgi:uncharacterized protein (TIGR03437 family)